MFNESKDHIDLPEPMLCTHIVRLDFSIHILMFSSIKLPGKKSVSCVAILNFRLWCPFVNLSLIDSIIRRSLSLKVRKASNSKDASGSSSEEKHLESTGLE